MSDRTCDIVAMSMADMQAAVQDPVSLAAMNESTTYTLSPDIPHVLHETVNNVVRTQGIAFVSAIHGLREVSELSTSEAAAIEAYNSLKGIPSSFQSPDVTISFREHAETGRQMAWADMVRPCMPCT